MFGIPHQVDFNVTQRCSYHCRDCHICNRDTCVKEMPTHSILNILKQLHDSGVCDITLTGGDPFLREDFKEILNYTCSLLRFNKITVKTNGLLITKAWIKSIKESCARIEITIRFDGYTPETYSILRQRKDDPSAVLEKEFSRVVRTIGRLLKENLDVSVVCMVTRENIDHIIKTYTFLKNLGVHNIILKKYSLPDDVLYPHKTHRLSHTAWSDFLVEVSHKKRTDHAFRYMNLMVGCPWELYMPLLEASWDVTHIEALWGESTPLSSPLYSKHRNVGCHAGIRSCAVLPNGDLYPCRTIPAKDHTLSCGNLHKEHFLNLLKRSKILKALKSLDLNDLKGYCTDCKYRKICGGGCRIRAYTRYKDLSAPDYLCPLQIKFIC